MTQEEILNLKAVLASGRIENVSVEVTSDLIEAFQQAEAEAFSMRNLIDLQIAHVRFDDAAVNDLCDLSGQSWEILNAQGMARCRQASVTLDETLAAADPGYDALLSKYYAALNANAGLEREKWGLRRQMELSHKRQEANT